MTVGNYKFSQEIFLKNPPILVIVLDIAWFDFGF